ncbi:TRAP transporter small permease [Mesorhizobium sp. CN2-181]|uniref:TRAP transporter small permease n=1 Tax=Mesorhizobium yinganensis TaxID=3157707 RepID=UPI0032B80B88
MEFLRLLAAIHDRLSRAGFAIAAVVLMVMTISYCFEVVSRYFFNSPTIWASPLVSYGLCASIFLALPDLARQGAHVSIDLHDQLVSPKVGALLLTATRLVSGFACFVGALITGAQMLSEYSMDVWTNTYLPIPKWWLFIVISYGLLSAGLYFFRQAFGDLPQPSSESASQEPVAK